MHLCLECGTPTRATRCASCAAAWNRVHRPYGREWREHSRQARAEQPSCENCGATRDLTVDHIVPHTLHGGTRVLCRSCHGSIGAKSGR